MPHINIKYFSSLKKEEQKQLVQAITHVITATFQCDESVVSVALEPVEQAHWKEQVYIPEIINRQELLHKSPNYLL